MARTHIRSEDVRGLLRLLGELRDVGQDPPTLLGHMYDGLLRIIGADGGPMSPLGDFRPGGTASLCRLDVRGFTADAERRIIADGLQGTATTEPAGAEFIRSYVPGRVMTRLRSELVSDTHWNGTPYGADVHRIAGVRDGLYSAAPGGSADVVGLCLYRSGAASRFGAVERDLLQLFHEQMVPIYRRAMPRPQPDAATVAMARLRPSYRATLRALLLGLSEKQIARRLGLAQCTVHDYVGALYARFGVTSRAELLARFIPPDPLGPDAPL